MKSFSKPAIILLFLVAILSAATEARAFLEVGTGISSTTAGRLVPAVSAAVRGSDWALFGSSVGVANKYYYHSGYSVAYYKIWKSDEFLWGATESGFGFGAYYATRGFQDTNETTETKSSDVAAGPAFRVKWFFLGPVYVQLDGLFGLRSLSQIITLQGQTHTLLSIGFTL